MAARGRYFLDTNVVVCALDDRDPTKQAVARELLRDAVTSQRGIVSFQVVQEFLNVALQKFEVPLPPDDAALFLAEFLEPICPVHSSVNLLRAAIDLKERWQFSFYDALIVAAALEGRCRTLYSEDFQDGMKIRTLTVRNPFVG